jgi:D-arabinose 5-phosphate isomerase GutQ
LARRNGDAGGLASAWAAGLIDRCLGVTVFAEIPQEAAVVLLSRSGRSIEIVRLTEKCRASVASIVAITNSPDSVLAISSDVALMSNTDLDHGVSITTYTALALTGGLLALRTVNRPMGAFAAELVGAL